MVVVPQAAKLRRQAFPAHGLTAIDIQIIEYLARRQAAGIAMQKL
jgi:hypothetical protein